MSKFYPWTPDGSNLEKSAAFENETQRLEGFKSGDTASSAILNTALCQSNLISVALVEALQKIYTNNDINATTKSLLENADIDSYKATMNQLATLFATSLTDAFAKANSVYYHQVTYSKVFTGSSPTAGSLHTLQFKLHIFDRSTDKATTITTSNIADRIMLHLTDNAISYWITDVVYKLSKGQAGGQTMYSVSAAKFIDRIDLGVTFKGLNLRVNKDGTDTDSTISDWATANSNYKFVVSDDFFSIADVLS